MTRWTNGVALVALCVGLATAVGHEGLFAASDSAGPHAYFNALVSRGDHWKSYSLRNQAQLGATNRWVTYSPATDPDPQAQDAAKVRIPAFTSWHTDQLAKDVGPEDLELWLSNAAGDVTKVNTGMNVRGMIVRLGNEYMTAIGSGSGTDYPLTRTGTNAGRYRLASRGSLGSTPRAHPAGTRVQWATNNLPNQVRLPLGTSDGHRWLITWDGYFTDSYVGVGFNNHKTFQLSSGTTPSIWLEPQTQYASTLIDRATDVASIGHARSYNTVGGPADWSASTGRQAGPGVTAVTPLRPQIASSIPLRAAEWGRWWVLIEQRANDYEYVSVWVATESRDAVQTIDRLPISIPPGQQDTIGHFWLEFNTSTDTYRGHMRDLIAYVRNVVVLRDPPEALTPLLVRPGDAPGVSVPRPGAPRNLRRILSGPS